MRGIKCPYCEVDIDIDKQLEIGLFNEMEDTDYDANCDSCKKDFTVLSEWTPSFETKTEEEMEDGF